MNNILGLVMCAFLIGSCAHTKQDPAPSEAVVVQEEPHEACVLAEKAAKIAQQRIKTVEGNYSMEYELVVCEIPEAPHDNIGFYIVALYQYQDGEIDKYLWLFGTMMKVDGMWHLPSGPVPVIELDYEDEEDLKGVLEVHKTE